MRSVRQGDLVVIAVYEGRLLLPQEQPTGVVLAVRHMEDSIHWIEGNRSPALSEYADLLVNGQLLGGVPTRWLAVVK